MRQYCGNARLRAMCGRAPCLQPAQISSPILPKWPPAISWRNASAVSARGNVRSTAGRTPAASNARTKSCCCRRLPTISPCSSLPPAHQRARRDLAAASGQHADQRDMSADAASRDRLRQRAGTANLDHMIGAAPAGEIEHGPAPVRRLTIVDRPIGAEGARTRQLLVGGRGDDHGRAHRLGDLQREIDTPPVPSASTTSPALRPPLTMSARHAVSPAVVSVAASTAL